MDRRRFLHPQHLAEAAGHAIGAAGELAAITPAIDAADERAFARLGWRAMATAFEMLLPLETPNAALGHTTAHVLHNARNVRRHFFLIDAIAFSFFLASGLLLVATGRFAVIGPGRNSPSAPWRGTGHRPRRGEGRPTGHGARARCARYNGARPRTSRSTH